MEVEAIPDTNWWLDQVKESRKLDTDTKLADWLLTTKAAISMQRKGESNMQMKSAVRCGDLLDINPLLVVCSVMYHTAHRPQDKNFWADSYWRAERSPDSRHRIYLKMPREPMPVFPAGSTRNQ